MSLTWKKLILYKRWLIEIANNMVSLSNLYDPSANALFQVGTLILDGRQFEFSVRVANPLSIKRSDPKAIYL